MGERRINLPVVIVLIIVFAALSGFGIYYHQKIYLPRLEEDIKNAQVEVRKQVRKNQAAERFLPN